MRHIILIRHGQYNLDGKCDADRTLTKLGQIQADYTGKRLKELGLPFVDFVKSTMARAQETGSIISKSLPNIKVEDCELLREGAPIPPEPPLGSWKQEMHVSNKNQMTAMFTNLNFDLIDFNTNSSSFMLMGLESRLLFANISSGLTPNRKKTLIRC